MVGMVAMVQIIRWVICSMALRVAAALTKQDKQPVQVVMVDTVRAAAAARPLTMVLQAVRVAMVVVVWSLL
jgi:thioesterase domain-containing protein